MSASRVSKGEVALRVALRREWVTGPLSFVQSGFSAILRDLKAAEWTAIVVSRRKSLSVAMIATHLGDQFCCLCSGERLPDP